MSPGWAFAAGFALCLFVRWLLDTTFGPPGYTEHRYPVARTDRWSSSDGQWRSQSHSGDPDIIRLADRRRGGAA